jgi:pimeloyl-ACP methyl ester carboxylesterase
VIVTAAGDPRVAAVIAQTPHVSGPATTRAIGPRRSLQLTAAALRDQAGALLGHPPRLMPVVGEPGTLAAMTSPDAVEGYAALFPDGFEPRNEFIPRTTLSLGFYSPIRKARAIRCPLLVQVRRDDSVTPAAPARRVAELAPLGELLEYPGDHFGIYVGEAFERAVADQVAFLERHLG